VVFFPSLIKANGVGLFAPLHQVLDKLVHPFADFRDGGASPFSGESNRIERVGNDSILIDERCVGRGIEAKKQRVRPGQSSSNEGGQQGIWQTSAVGLRRRAIDDPIDRQACFGAPLALAVGDFNSRSFLPIVRDPAGMKFNLSLDL
jgi:hypothetical protein